MDKVRFTTIQEDDDLILSFSFDEGTEFGVEGFMVHRCPKYEFALMPYERGPSVTWTDDDEIVTVETFELSRASAIITTRYRQYAFDISGLSEHEVKVIGRVVGKMNFDNNFKFIYAQS